MAKKVHIFYNFKRNGEKHFQVVEAEVPEDTVEYPEKEIIEASELFTATQNIDPYSLEFKFWQWA